MAPSAMDDYDDDQPTTKLSSAFIVVLILHVVAVGGIFAFKGIKAHRTSREIPVAATTERPTTRTGLPEQTNSNVHTTAVATSPAPAPSMQRVYKAHGGETLAKIASLHGVSASELASHNGINTSASLKANQSIVIPQSKAAKPAHGATKTTNAATTTGTTANGNVVQRASFLATKKDEKDSTTAFKATTPKASSTKSSGKTYTVAKNDTITTIARKHGVSVDALMKLNKIEDPKKLQPNQHLQIPAK
jgi:LysM repeat protein